MTNKEIIKEFIEGTKRYNAVNHIGYTDNKLWNYSTVLIEIDREAKKAKLNIKKYSTTTGRIQSEIERQLSAAHYEIERYTGENAVLWNYGYQGAATWKKSDFKPLGV